MWSISVKFVFIDFFIDSGFVDFSRIMTMLLSGMKSVFCVFPLPGNLLLLGSFLVLFICPSVDGLSITFMSFVPYILA